MQATQSRITKMMATRKRNHEARTERIRSRFNELHNDRRIRYDDVLESLSREFCLAQSTILSALKSA